MELKDFVRASLVQIAQGAHEAREEVHAVGGVVNPAVGSAVQGAGDKRHFATLDNGCPVFLVGFDVAVTVTDAGEISGGAKGGLLQVFSARVDGKEVSSTASVSRIRFDVPMALGVDPTTAQELADKERARERSMQEAAEKFNRRRV